MVGSHDDRKGRQLVTVHVQCMGEGTGSKAKQEVKC